MKNRTALLTLVTVIVIFPFGKFISRTITDAMVNKNNVNQTVFDRSLRNFHSNKGE